MELLGLLPFITHNAWFFGFVAGLVLGLYIMKERVKITGEVRTEREQQIEELMEEVGKLTERVRSLEDQIIQDKECNQKMVDILTLRDPVSKATIKTIYETNGYAKETNKALQHLTKSIDRLVAIQAKNEKTLN